MSRTRIALISTLAVAAVVATTSAARPSHAAAVNRFHVALTKAEPGVNDTVAASPKEIKLWFSEPVQAAVTAARITGPDEHVVAVGAMHIADAPKSPAVAEVTETLKPGSYSVAWKTMAADGHPASGTFTFVVRGAK